MAALFDIAATTLAFVGEWSAFPRAPRLLRGPQLSRDFGQRNALKEAMSRTGQTALLRKVAAPARPGQVEVLPSAPNEFSKNCDIYGGFGGFGGNRRF
jgi:hypothetical protein